MRHNFKELRSWQLAMEVIDEVYTISSSFPKDERFGLTLQIRKSAISIASNISEGCGRSTTAQTLHFLDISMGSSHELETQLLIALRRDYYERTLIDNILQKNDEVQRIILGFQDYIKGMV